MVMTRVLPSGIRVVMEQIPYVQSVAFGVWIKAGACDEDAKYAGISHYIEHMMFKGTSSRTAREIASDIDKIGGQINAFTGKEATCYYVKSISSNYKKAADVIIDMLTDSLFDKIEMDKERKVICEEIKMTKDTPDDLAHDTITSMVFKGTPLGNSIIGTPTSLKRITQNVMRRYFSTEYTRDSIVISVAGNFDPDDLCSYLSDQFSNLTASKKKKECCGQEYRPSCKVITKDIEQSHLCLAVKGLPLGDDRYYAFSILNNIMGGSMSSRLFQNIREQQGLAYSVYSMAGSFQKDGYFNIYAGVSHDRIREAVRGIRHELAVLEEKGITAEELSSSREQLKASYIFGQENVSGRMFKNGKNALMEVPILTAEEVISGFDKVTMEDIDSVKELICDFNNYSAALVTKHKTDLKGIMER